MLLALAVPVERVLSQRYHRAEYILCDQPPALALRESAGHWFMLAALVFAIGVLIVARMCRRRHKRGLATGLLVVGLVVVLAMNVGADGCAAGGDAVAKQTSIPKSQEECTNLHPTNLGWFDWTPLGH